jgi:hypothetical protein
VHVRHGFEFLGYKIKRGGTAQVQEPRRAGRKTRSRRRLGQREMAINYRTRFAYRIDMWDADGENIIEHLAGVEDLPFAKATYRAACKQWPGAPITLSEGMHVIEDNRRKRLV